MAASRILIIHLLAVAPVRRSPIGLVEAKGGRRERRLATLARLRRRGA